MGSARASTVVVRPAAALAARPRLFAALGAAFNTRFVAEPPQPGAADALIAFGDAADHGGRSPALPTVQLRDLAERAPSVQPVRVADRPPVDQRVRGIGLHEPVSGPPAAGARPAAVLAAADDGPVWSLVRADAPVHDVRATLPELGPDEPLYTLLSRRPIAMLALVHLLRALPGAAGAGAPPPLRACFIFDDPNLRWRTYGFIDYRRLVEHADRHGYHAAMAMIPLDVGRAHRPTVDLFARRRDRLSLVCHGNDHSDRELLAVVGPDAALAVAAQARHRLRRFERRHGVSVDAVMTPPHGVCSRPMTRAVGALGFDALCTIHPRPWVAGTPTDHLLAGWHPAEFVQGCAVIPRVPMISSEADLALRAFLDHPMVIYGHHEDVADGLDVLADITARVNRLGNVRWMSVGAIAHTNYATTVAAGVCEVRPYSRRVRVAVPEAASTVTVPAPLECEGGSQLIGWRLGDGAVVDFGAPLAVAPGRTVELRLAGADDVAPEGVPVQRAGARSTLRRAATELRDRALPVQSGPRRVRRPPPPATADRVLASAPRPDGRCGAT